MESNAAVVSESPKAKESMESNAAVVSESPKAKESMESTAEVVSESPEAKEEAKNIGSNGKIENNKTPVILAVAMVAAAADRHGNVATSTSSAKPESPQKIENMMKKKKSKVQVSNTKKSFIFYLNLAKRYINEHNEVQLCGLGMAIPTVVTIAEILKRKGLAIQIGIMTSTVLGQEEDKKGRRIEKAKIEIVLGKAEKLGETNAVVTPNKAADKKA